MRKLREEWQRWGEQPVRLSASPIQKPPSPEASHLAQQLRQDLDLPVDPRGRGLAIDGDVLVIAPEPHSGAELALELYGEPLRGALGGKPARERAISIRLGLILAAGLQGEEITVPAPAASKLLHSLEEWQYLAGASEQRLQGTRLACGIHALLIGELLRNVASDPLGEATLAASAMMAAARSAISIRLYDGHPRGLDGDAALERALAAGPGWSDPADGLLGVFRNQQLGMLRSEGSLSWQIDLFQPELRGKLALAQGSGAARPEMSDREMIRDALQRLNPAVPKLVIRRLAVSSSSDPRVQEPA